MLFVWWRIRGRGILFFNQHKSTKARSARHVHREPARPDSSGDPDDSDPPACRWGPTWLKEKMSTGMKGGYSLGQSEHSAFQGGNQNRQEEKENKVEKKKRRKKEKKRASAIMT